MNPETLKEAIELASSLKKEIAKLKNTRVVIFPPFPFISEIYNKVSQIKNLSVGAQDCFYEEKGSFTGNVSFSMLSSVGVKYVIIGHSEKRAEGETHEAINKKIKILLKNGFKVVLCIGEKERDESGDFLKFVELQMKEDLKSIQGKYFKNLIVAYEPVWAIGKDAKRNCTSHETAEMSLFIKKILVEIGGREAGIKVPILYGGSVDKDNSGEYLKDGGVDGLLIGRASLKSEKFLEIIKIAENLK